ncbi:hypothetical protein PHYPO_G00202600 [Pangasianodon hypophthalmus]|uniref:Uncharacterized protein n=1 Tax=Pangasianodon hypophthalmus TaxID=310915 RepID=A0A5N5PCW6_PANHP|nr:hypothetical protein PHYPO_G00202600 [Pangasianodon hypophthalmus]
MPYSLSYPACLTWETCWRPAWTTSSGHLFPWRRQARLKRRGLVLLSLHPSTVTENLSLTDVAARLKQLEIESTPTSAPARSNVNVNMNNQEDVLKLTEKSLSSVSSSPVLSQLKAPDELKSNILKAQAEAVLRGTREEIGVTGEKNCNLQEAVARLKGRGGQTGSTSSLTMGSREALMQTCSSSLEVKADEFISS